MSSPDPLLYLPPFPVASSGGAVDEGLVRELERQEGAARAVQRGHKQRPGGLPHQLAPTSPGCSGSRRSQHGSGLLPPQGTAMAVTHRLSAHMLCTNNTIQNPTNFSCSTFPQLSSFCFVILSSLILFYLLDSSFFCFFLSVLLQKLLRKGAFLLSPPFTAPSNCPVDPPSLTVCMSSAVHQARLDKRLLVLRLGLGGA